MLESLADAYGKANPSVSIAIKAASPSEAIHSLETQQVDLIVLDRSVTYTEAIRVRSLTNHDLVGTPYAITGVGIYVHDSHPAKSLTLEQLKRLFLFQVISWDELGFEADGKILTEYRPGGVKLSKGSVPIRMYLPSDKQGANSLIARRLLSGQSWPTRVTIFDTADSLLDKIAVDSHGIGVTALTAHEHVKALAIRATEHSQAIAPTADTLRNRTYPLSHYLYFYSIGQPEGAAKDFIVFVLSEQGQHMIDAIEPTVTSLDFYTKP